MKKLMKCMAAALVLLGIVGNLIAVPAFAAESDYSCSDYYDCTADGGEIYEIVKSGCPIRAEAHNKGKVIARGEVGTLISVKNVFWTAKLAKWCEIVLDNGISAFIHIDNCTPHEHSFMTIVENEEGYIDYCAVCGLAKAEAAGEAATCDLTCVADQAVKGSFSEYNPTFTSILAQMIVAEIGGPMADARDLAADIMHKEPAWVIAMDLAAFLPLVGALKFSDELVILGKNVDDISAAAKNTKKIIWGKWEDYDKVWENGTEYAQIGDYKYTKHAVSEFLNPSIETNQINKVEHSRGVPASYVDWVLTEGRKLGSTSVVKEEIVNGAKRVTYANGSLWVSVEDGDKVITIITK